MIKKIGFLVLLAALSGAASARETCTIHQVMGYHYRACVPDDTGSDASPVVAPRINSTSVVAAFTVVLSGLTLLYNRRLRDPSV